jgi:NAD(P)-dependent dehydrogenase (short-subunit alcohol dehydrogenase family)
LDPRPSKGVSSSAVSKARFAGKAVLVTGAGSGIGQATAIAFAEEGAELFLCDVNEAGLAGTAAATARSGGRVHTFVVDVSKRDAMQRFADDVHSKVSAVDVLVNNAGVGLGARFLETSLEDWEWILSVNLWGVIHGCHFFVPAMARRGEGHVVNVASAAGLVTIPDLAAYGTTKFAVVGLTEALREEVRSLGLGVTTICPGIVNTPITQSSPLRGARGATREQMIAFYRKRNYGPEKVGSAIVEAVVHRREIVPVAPEAWALYAMKRLMPATTPRLLFGLAQRQAARDAKKLRKQ